MIPSSLKGRLIAASAAGALAIAGVLVTNFEGRYHTPYRDPAGILTVCEGHTGSDIIPGKRYSDAECDALRDADLRTAEQAVDRLVKVPVSAWEKAALIDFAFNAGPGNLSRSTLLRKLNTGDRTGSCREYRKWVNGGGRKLPGLVNRREADMWVCQNG